MLRIFTTVGVSSHETPKGFINFGNYLRNTLQRTINRAWREPSQRLSETLLLNSSARCVFHCFL